MRLPAAFDLYLDPGLDDTTTVLAGMADAVCRIVSHQIRGTSRAYRDLAGGIGLDLPFKRGAGHVPFHQLLGRDVVAKLGDYPHTAIDTSNDVCKTSAGGLVTRNLRMTCPDCGYAVLVTRKWLSVGRPLCPGRICEIQGTRLILQPKLMHG